MQEHHSIWSSSYGRTLKFAAMFTALWMVQMNLLTYQNILQEVAIIPEKVYINKNLSLYVNWSEKTDVLWVYFIINMFGCGHIYILWSNMTCYL
jgi:hypothetical protein